MNFIEEIIDLIELKKEGNYWDFKEYWHDNNADLLHDIICFANNLANRDSYIIIGVEDKSYTITDVKNDPNRKNQQNIIDFLKSKKFIGGIRPDIEVKTIEIQNCEIDILIIKNSFNTPYFLLEDYRDNSKVVKKHSIYTRIGDTNTPKDNIADINHIEYLWKKRFLLTESPVKRIFELLKEKQNWEEKHINNQTIYHYSFNPEFTLVIEDDDNNRTHSEFYSKVMTNDNQSYSNLYIKYFGTVIYECQLTYLDGGRLLIPTPEWSYIQNIKRENFHGAYKYYINGSNRNKLLNFFYDDQDSEERYAKSSLDEIILYFNSETQKINFELYVINNHDKINKEIDNEIKLLNYITCLSESETNYMKTHIAFGKVLNKYFKTFLNNRYQINNR